MVASGEIFVMGMVLPLNFTLRLMVVAPLALPPVTPLSIFSVSGCLVVLWYPSLNFIFFYINISSVPR